jgi:hypothetical protein
MNSAYRHVIKGMIRLLQTVNDMIGLIQKYTEEIIEPLDEQRKNHT